jgi:hypothetical protein
LEGEVQQTQLLPATVIHVLEIRVEFPKLHLILKLWFKRLVEILAIRRKRIQPMAEPLARVLVEAPHSGMPVVTVAVEPMAVKIQVCAVQAVAVEQGALVLD